MLGMALSGPDTGSSQWFINLSPQPHLDGTYTVFGRVVGGNAALVRITQGDVIRTVVQ
jgi:cyclophilin family peptidyl-prolyl cis-trans isomerase